MTRRHLQLVLLKNRTIIAKSSSAAAVFIQTANLRWNSYRLLVVLNILNIGSWDSGTLLGGVLYPLSCLVLHPFPPQFPFFSFLFFLSFFMCNGVLSSSS